MYVGGHSVYELADLDVLFLELGDSYDDGEITSCSFEKEFNANND